MDIISFEKFYNNENSGFWKKNDMIYEEKLKIIKKFSAASPLVLNFDELKINPFISFQNI